MTRRFIFSYPAGCDDERVNKTRGLTAAGLSIVAATYGLARYCFGLFLPEIQQEFELSSEVIGLIAGSSYAGYLAATFAGSWLSTMFGPRLPIVLGGLAATVGMATIGLAPGALSLAVGVFIAGASPGLAYPPFSDVIVKTIRPDRQNTVYAWINSGTGFGVALAAPLAFWAGADWRLAWLAFAVFALAVTVWNGLVIAQGHSIRAANPGRATKSGTVGDLFARLFRKAAAPLFCAAFLFGVVTAIYWTYAVDLLRMLTGDPRDAIAFWITLGVAGIFGCFAGRIVDRWGLRQAYAMLVVVVGAAIATLPLTQTTPGIYASAMFFGVGFIVTTALFGMWSMRTFNDVPSIGFGATFFLISLGQGVGPVVGGFMIPLVGQSLLFVFAGLLSCALLVCSPQGAAIK